MTKQAIRCPGCPKIFQDGQDTQEAQDTLEDQDTQDAQDVQKAQDDQDAPKAQDAKIPRKDIKKLHCSMSCRLIIELFIYLTEICFDRDFVLT